MGIVCDWVSERFGEGEEGQFGSRRAGRGGRIEGLCIPDSRNNENAIALWAFFFLSFRFFSFGRVLLFLFFTSPLPPPPSHPPINAVGIVFLYCIVIVLYCYCYCISHSYCCNVFQKVGCFGWGDGVVASGKRRWYLLLPGD